MPITIRKHGNRYGKTKHFLCTSCWCDFDATEDECFTEHLKDGFTVRYKPACRCPECGRTTTEYE